jgi:hypothetical protein
MYYKGQGVEQNYAEAVRYFKKAADQGSVDAQVELGSMYHDGQGVEKDYVMAVAYWSVALTLGNDKVANHNLLVALTEMTTEEYREGRRQAAIIMSKIPK